MADRFRKNYPLGSAYVSAFDARPRLHFRIERNRRYTSLSFVKAVCKEANRLTYDELKHAYHVAGDSFVGQLKELFIILDDDQAKKGSSAGGRSRAAKQSKGKRRASGEAASEVRNKVPATQ